VQFQTNERVKTIIFLKKRNSTKNSLRSAGWSWNGVREKYCWTGWSWSWWLE